MSLGHVLLGRADGEGSEHSGWGRGYSTVSRLEGFIGGPVLVDRTSHLVPLSRTCVRGPSGCHSSYGILYLGIETPSEFDHDGLWIGVARFSDEVLKFIQVII
jgi:hypothetical protein